MTREELKKVFGDSLTRLKPLEIKPEKIDAAKFTDLAVFMSEDCSEVLAIKASIDEPKTVKCHGVIPQKQPDDGIPRFNCIVGEYEESRCTVTLDFGGLAKQEWQFAANRFGATYVYASRPGIYRTSVPEDAVGRLTEKNDGSHKGFFRTAAAAAKAVKNVSGKYRKTLLSKINNIVSDDTLERGIIKQ